MERNVVSGFWFVFAERSGQSAESVDKCPAVEQGLAGTYGVQPREVDGQVRGRAGRLPLQRPALRPEHPRVRRQPSGRIRGIACVRGGAERLHQGEQSLRMGFLTARVLTPLLARLGSRTILGIGERDVGRAAAARAVLAARCGRVPLPDPLADPDRVEARVPRRPHLEPCDVEQEVAVARAAPVEDGRDPPGIKGDPHSRCGAVAARMSVRAAAAEAQPLLSIS